jgi:hypothetical protein
MQLSRALYDSGALSCFFEKREQNRQNRILSHHEDRLIPFKNWPAAWMSFSAQLRVSEFEILHDLEKGVLVRIAGSHADNNTANTDANPRSNLEQLQPDGMALGLGDLCSLQPLGSQLVHEHIRQ